MTQKDITEEIARHLTETVLVTRGHEIVEPFTSDLAAYICAISPEDERIAVAPQGLVHVSELESNGPSENSRVTGLELSQVETFEKWVAAAEGVIAHVSFCGHPHGSHATTFVNIISAAELRRVAKMGSRYSKGKSGKRLMFNYKRREAESEGGPAQGVIEATLNVAPLPQPDPKS